MTQEEKDILNKDLCVRLPYGVIVETPKGKGYVCDINLTIFGTEAGVNINATSRDKFNIEDIQPYLIPLSSMSEEQKEELITITNGKFRYMWGVITNAIPRKNTSEWGVSENAFIDGIEVINILYIWLLKNHFDINGLIPMGLANDATNLNIY